MSSSIVDDTLGRLEEARTRHSGVLVAYSGGKDSLVVMDLCSRVFDRVHPFYMYVVPGLAWVKERLSFAQQRWGKQVDLFPHWTVFRFKEQGIYCKSEFQTVDTVIPKIGLNDVYGWAREQTGIDLVATGAKAADGVWRKRHMKTSSSPNTIWPLAKWTKFDVIGYLRAQRIPIPPSDGSALGGGGEDLSARYLLWLHDTHPKDFELAEQEYPFIRAVVKRREFYGESKEASGAAR